MPVVSFRAAIAADQEKAENCKGLSRQAPGIYCTHGIKMKNLPLQKAASVSNTCWQGTRNRNQV